MEKQCLSCQEKIVGRSDKKFCSDGCRNDYHNRANQNRLSMLRSTNNKLRRNYKILSEVVLKEGKGKTSKVTLINKGFIFDLFTSIYQTQKGSEYHFVYDLGYLKLSENMYVVVKRY